MMITEEELAARKALLCEKYDNVVKLTYHFGVLDSDRDDVVQEVFIAAYTHLRQLRNVASMDSWLYKITMRCAGKVHKRNKKKFACELQYESCLEALELMQEHAYELAAEFGGKDIFELMGELTPPAPKILQLRYVHGLSMVEIAKLLDMNYNSVKTIENRARKVLRKMIEERSEARDETRCGTSNSGSTKKSDGYEEL